MNNGLKSGLVLLVLGIICGTLLALVNSFTAPVIADIEEDARYAALEEFYTTTDYDLSAVEVNEDTTDTIFVLRNKSTSDIEALVYLVNVWGWSGDKPVSMLIAINQDMSVQGYKVVNHGESTGFGADIVENDFNISDISDLSGFDSVAGSTLTSDAILGCFGVVQNRASADFGGGLDD